MEENTLKLQQVICPSCKRPINTFNPNKLTAECPFCHSKLVNPLVSPKDVRVPERIIPFTTDENSFEQCLINALINQDYVPTNIFETISTGDVVQAYLPMYLFEGTFNASWSCESSYMDQKVSVSSNSVKTKDVKKWRPQNGNASGNFAFLCLANEGEDIPEELRKFTRLFPYDVMLSKEYKDGMIDFNDENLMTLECNADATLVWQKHGKEMVEETAQKAAMNQIGDQEIRNFRASSSHNLTTTGKYVFVPFWFVYYNFGGQQYHFMMDGTASHNSFTNPVDQEEVNFVNGKEKIKTIVKWLWPIAILFCFAGLFTIAIAFLAVWFIAKIVVNKIMDNKIHARLEESKRKRQECANRIK